MSSQTGQQNVLSRLHGLFPSSPPPTPPAADATASAHPKFLKVKIVTWNMHDSVPKGDLQELLGKVPIYTPPKSNPSTSFPQLASDKSHPYHLVVVAGQECPSVSGIPMGIGAGFSLYDKEKEKQEKDIEPRSSKHSSKDRDGESSRVKRNVEDPPHEAAVGWTAMVEDWLCYGGCHTSCSPTASEISAPMPLSPRISSSQPKRGPYQLLVKERMMGIYVSIYIHRDIRSLVEGTSKSVVTAGLIGGRLGNKGGVGISLKIAGTSMLFLNCHLAAHEGKVHHRLANWQKIKAELSVDEFLQNDDPRVMSEDLTDKFDYTFLFGDLNFRLDISRLHADWLIARQDYAQALAFDQLKATMDKGHDFDGFKEGPIDFPPTFKYDVLRTLKRKHLSKSDRWRTHGKDQHRITEVEEREVPDEDDEEEPDNEAASMASSTWTSSQSRRDDGEEDYFGGGSPSRSQGAFTPGSKLSLSLFRARSRWLLLFTPSAPGSPTRWLKSKKSLPERSPTKMNGSSLEVPRSRTGNRTTSLDADRSLLRLPSRSRLSSKTKSSMASDDEDDDSNADRGVYDSSTKKRVPSWCDRILWKSTVVPEPEPEEADSTDLQKPRNRFGQFFAHAFRPISSRVSRRESYSSMTSIAACTTSTTTGDTPTQPELVRDFASSSPDPEPFSRFVVGNRLTPSRSVDHPPPPLKETASGLRRSVSSASSRQSKILTTTRSPRRAITSPPETVLPVAATRIRWRFLPSFMTSTSPNLPEPSVQPPPPPAQIPRKGDVICLDYNTLDDRAMRRLEGRSDHRPVIGSYAIYL